MTIAAAIKGPSAYWYLTRGTGAVSLVLLTLSVALGVMNIRRVRTEQVPRFVFDSLHRTASLLAVAFVIVHVLTSLLDSFAPIRVVDAVVPFVSAYRPLWLGLGAVGFDLLIAVTITSLARRRFGYRTWRATHWLAYASWPVSLLHGLGTGSDTKVGWMLALTALCMIAVIVAVVARATEGWPRHAGVRLTALGATAIMPIGLLIWLPSGPLAKGWAKRAGTPASLLVASAGGGSTQGASTPSSSSGSSSSSSPSTSFTAPVSGTVRQGESGSGLAIVDISLNVSGQHLSRLRIRIAGQAIDGGGVSMSSSRVTFGSSANPDQYRGQVTALQGTDVQALVSDASGSRLSLTAQLQLDGRGNAAGTLTAAPGGGG